MIKMFSQMACTLSYNEKKYAEILLNYRQLFVKGNVIIGEWGIIGAEILFRYSQFFIKCNFVIGGVVCICHSVFFVLPRASYGYIQCGIIPCVAWRFSNYYFQLLRCSNLALYRFFSYFSLRGRNVSHLGASVCPHVWMPPMFSHPICLDAPTPPYVPNAPLCICMF